MATTKAEPKPVFVNCPFDGEYRPLFHAIVFTVVRCGFRPRCALEVNDTAQVRIEKIAKIIGECMIGIHDISRTELDAVNGLPRFNMPLELGLYLGARYYGGSKHRRKACLVMDREQYRYQKFISDIAGQDISAHSDEIERCIGVVRDFLNGHNGRVPLPSGDTLVPEYERFQAALPAICANLRVNPDTLDFTDFDYIVTDYVSEDKAPSGSA